MHTIQNEYLIYKQYLYKNLNHIDKKINYQLYKGRMHYVKNYDIDGKINKKQSIKTINAWGITDSSAFLLPLDYDKQM